MGHSALHTTSSIPVWGLLLAPGSGFRPEKVRSRLHCTQSAILHLAADLYPKRIVVVDNPLCEICEQMEQESGGGVEYLSGKPDQEASPVSKVRAGLKQSSRAWRYFRLVQTLQSSARCSPANDWTAFASSSYQAQGRGRVPVRPFARRPCVFGLTGRGKRKENMRGQKQKE